MVKLIKIADGSEINSLSYGKANAICASQSGQSIGRYPDGTGNFVLFSSSTRDNPNTSQQTSCPTPSPTPTPTASPTPSPTPTPTATPSPTPKPTIKSTPTSRATIEPLMQQDSSEEILASPQVLGENYDFAQASPSPDADYSGGSNKTAILLMAGGIGFIGVALLPFLKRALKRYEQSS